MSIWKCKRNLYRGSCHFLSLKSKKLDFKLRAKYLTKYCLEVLYTKLKLL